jgi:hypothetical protein
MGKEIKVHIETRPGASDHAQRDTIKRLVKYGVFLWWSDQTPSWVHPDDMKRVEGLVPGNRIFRRDECENYADRELGYSRLVYGDIEFRALPSIWLEVAHEGFELNDFVEIKSRFGKLRPRIATIREIVWNRRSQSIEYFMTMNGLPSSRAYCVHEFQPAIRLGTHLGERELKMASRAKLA